MQMNFEDTNNPHPPAEADTKAFTDLTVGRPPARVVPSTGVDIDNLIVRDALDSFEKCQASGVPIRKPDRLCWFSPIEGTEHHLVFRVVVTKGNEHFVVSPEVATSIGSDAVCKVLIPCILRSGGYCLWPIRVPGPNGQLDTWNESAMEAAQEHGGRWIRLKSNPDLGVYEIAVAAEHIPPPKWEADPAVLIRLALKDRIITSIDHPVIRRLQGLD